VLRSGWVSPPSAIIVSGFYSAGGDNGVRGTDSPGGRHPIQTNSAPAPVTPHFYAECPSCHNPPNFSWLGTGTELCWLAYPVDWLLSGLAL